MSELINRAMEEIKAFERPSAKTSKELIDQLNKANERISELEQENETLSDDYLVDVKRAFWWSAEFTHVVHDGKINDAWQDYATRLVSMTPQPNKQSKR